jgi:hypothetical protein
MNSADRIRKLVAETFGPSGREFKHIDIMNTVAFPADVWNGRDDKSSHKVASAMNSWVNAGFIVSGYSIQNLASDGANRRYKLELVTGGASEVARPKPEPDSEQPDLMESLQRVVKATRRGDVREQLIKTLVGREFTGEIIDIKDDGSMLVKLSGGTFFTLRKLEW